MVDDGESPTIGSPILLYRGNSAQATTLPITWSDASTTTTYVRMGNSSTTDTLNFNAEIDEFNLVTNFNSLFSKYYKNYIEDAFDYRSRLLRFKAMLPLYILLSYKMNDRFVIANRRYKINTIDVNLKTGESKIELLNEI